MTATKQTDPYRTKYHRDGSVTVWDCRLQQWVRVSRLDDGLSATLMPEERARIERHTRHAR